MVSTFARVTVQPGRGDEFASLLPAFAEHARGEPGTLLYVLNRSGDDPDVFWFSEVYEDDAARDAHRTSAFVTEELPRMREYFADVQVLHGSVVAASGISARDRTARTV